LGKIDTITKKYTSQNNVFADAFNYFIYGGKAVINPSDLKTTDITEITALYDKSGKDILALQKFRDVLKNVVIKENDEAVYAILGIENQTHIHYAMVVRNMLYDAINYAKQVENKAKENKKNKNFKTDDEFLSGFLKTDKLLPVITLVIYFGSKEWDGARCLHDMLETDSEDILKFVDNCKLNIITPYELSEEDLAKFSTDLRNVLEFIKYSQDDKKIQQIVNNDHTYSNISSSAAYVIKECTGSDFTVDVKKGDVVDMCQALVNIKNDGIKIGREDGIKIGREDGIKIGRNDGIKIGREDGIKIGRNNGILETQIKIAKNLINLENFSDEKIQNITGLALEEIKKLRDL
jgi:hypothetical protein